MNVHDYKDDKQATELDVYLNAVMRAESYVTLHQLSRTTDTAFVTELVQFEGAHGGALGPMVRKTIPLETGLGQAYEVLFHLMQTGKRFKHLPRILDCYKTGSALMVISEYIPGVTLKSYVEKLDCSNQKSQIVQTIIPELCEAVSELHHAAEPPLIHRDLKPQNVIVASAGLFLIDFGIARRVRSDSNADTVKFGTRNYAPPEQFGFGQTDVRSDIYALGMLILFCLTGIEPENHAHAYVLLDELEKNVQPLYVEVIKRAIELDPAERFESVDAMLDVWRGKVTLLRVPLTRAGVFSVNENNMIDDQTESFIEPQSVQSSFQSAKAALRTIALKQSKVSATDARKHKHVRAPHTYAHSLTVRLSDRAALIYDFCLAAVVVVFIAAFIDQIFHPQGSNIGQPLWYRAGMCIAFIIPLTIGPIWFIADKRFLAQKVPRFAQRLVRQDIGVWVIWLVSAFAILVLAGAFAGL